MSKNTSPYKQAEDQTIILQFLKDKAFRTLENQISEGWIRWKNLDLEGVVRLTAHGEWQLLADPKGEWDRCANAAFCVTLPEKICEISLEACFARLRESYDD